MQTRRHKVEPFRTNGVMKLPPNFAERLLNDYWELEIESQFRKHYFGKAITVLQLRAANENDKLINDMHEHAGIEGWYDWEVYQSSLEIERESAEEYLDLEDAEEEEEEEDEYYDEEEEEDDDDNDPIPRPIPPAPAPITPHPPIPILSKTL